MSLFIDNMYRHYQCKRAESIAHKAHKDQKRKGTNEDYIEHPKAVVQRLINNGITNKIYHAVAWLHDVIEDTNITALDLKKQGISDEVVEIVELLTKKEGQKYEDYLSELKKNNIAKTVKIEDMLANLADRPSKKQILKYSKALQYLIED